MTFYQFFLPIASLLYFLLVFVLRSLILWKKTGINPFVFGRTDRAHDYIGATYKIIVLGLWASIICYSFFPESYHFLVPINYLEDSRIQFSGLVLLIVSFTWTSIAQYQMSTSWRIGINYEEETALVKTGLFSLSRNPIFLGVLLSYLGTFLIMPNTISFTIFWITYVTIQIQVRLEEEYLESVHGAQFDTYRKQVRRWI